MAKFSLILKAVLVCIPASLFAGAIMISISLGSLFPQVDSIANPLLERDGQKIIVEKEDYSYGPGQQGRAIHHYLVNGPGEKEEVTFKLSLYSSIIYTLILMFLSLLTALIYQLSRRLRLASFAGTTFLASIVVALAVSGVVVIAAVGAFVQYLFGKG